MRPQGGVAFPWRCLVRRADRMRLSVTSRRPGGVGQPPRQAAGHYGECLNWANALEQPPRRAAGRVARGPADLGSESGLTERRILGESSSRKGALWLHALGGGAFPPVVFEHVTESSATVRAERDDRLPAQVHRSQKSCGGEAGLNLKAKDPPEANAPSAVPVFLGAHGLRNRVHSVTGRNRSCPPASLWRTLSLSIEARKR